MSKIVISVDPFVMKVAKIDNNRLKFFFIKKKNNPDIVGNVYKGKARDIVPPLGAAFVDIGYDRKGFLCTCKSGDLNGLKEGDDVLVQVCKPPVASKGPKLTNKITIPGNYLVLVKDGTSGISRHIEDLEEKQKLDNFLKKHSCSKYGFIARTASRHASEKELDVEAERLISIAKDIEAKYQQVEAPALLYKEPPMPVRIIRDYCDEETEEVIINDNPMFGEILSYLRETNTRYADRLKLYNKESPIFEHFNVENDIKSLENNIVYLRNGGYIVIEKTEALFAIDVNSGSYKTRYLPDEAIFEINREAAYEIFRQIDLRDMGGLIVIDFIDMKNEKHKKQLEEILITLAKQDKKKTFVSGISPFGLVEVSRQKNTSDMFDEMFEKCEYCFSNGLVKSPLLVCSEIYEKMRCIRERAILRANPTVINTFMNEVKDKNITYEAEESLKSDEYYIEVIG